LRFTVSGRRTAGKYRRNAAELWPVPAAGGNPRRGERQINTGQGSLAKHDQGEAMEMLMEMLFGCRWTKTADAADRLITLLLLTLLPGCLAGLLILAMS
jgi:hypothetical protein